MYTSWIVLQWKIKDKDKDKDKSCRVRSGEITLVVASQQFCPRCCSRGALTRQLRRLFVILTTLLCRPVVFLPSRCLLQPFSFFSTTPNRVHGRNIHCCDGASLELEFDVSRRVKLDARWCQLSMQWREPNLPHFLFHVVTQGARFSISAEVMIHFDFRSLMGLCTSRPKRHY